MIESNCFLKLDHECQITELQINPNLSPNRSIIDVASYQNRKLADGYQNDPLLTAVYDRFAPTWELHNFQIHKLLPHSCYDWHVDGRNGSSLNCVLEEYDSLTFFYDDTIPGREQVLDIVTMKYEPKKWYAFNPKIHHTVFNFGNVPRYMITAPLTATVTYSRLLEWYRTTFKS